MSNLLNSLQSPVPLSKMIPDLHKTRFIIYTGAGISIPPPTCAPSWWTLTEEIITAFFNKIPEEWGLPKDLIIHDPDMQPELVFENFATLFDQYLYQVFDALNVGRPNLNHYVIALLAKQGILKACFTTNFDTYLEQALRELNVSFDLVVKNDEFDAFFAQIKNANQLPKFVLCKIHGTTEKPDTIVSVASAYKSAKGFSPPKSQVLEWLLQRYPCLFLGYSGWDFEHSNYRHFWNTVGPTVKKIYWNRRIGEKGGPKFSEIFELCRDRFEFCESDLPGGWLSAINSADSVLYNSINAQLPPSIVQNIENNNTAVAWDKTKSDRLDFFKKWAEKLPEGQTLAAVIVQGNLFSQTFKEARKRVAEQGKAMLTPTPQQEAQYNQGMQTLTAKFSAQQLDAMEYQKQMNDLNLARQYNCIAEKYRGPIKALIDENRFPGTTDDPNKLLQFINKILSILDRYDVENGAKIVVEYMKRDNDAMMKGYLEGLAEMSLNQMVLGIISPKDSDWKPLYEKMLIEKEKFLKNEIDQATYQANLKVIFEKGKKAEFGLIVPVEKLFDQLLNLTAQSPTFEQFSENAEAVYLAVMLAIGHINMRVVNTNEFKQLQTVANPTQIPQAPKVDYKVYEKKMNDLVAELSAGKITPEEYGAKMQEITKEMTANSQPQAVVVGPVNIPIEILNQYDKKIRGLFKAAFDKENEYTGHEMSNGELLLEMAVMVLWITSTRFLDIASGTQYQSFSQQGKYPMVTANPSVVQYIRNNANKWLDKALIQLPGRFGQRLSSLLAQLGEMGNDFELCKQATLRSLEYSEGKITEITPAEIPISLAAFYESKGDMDNAFKYYMMALGGLRSAVPSIYADIVIYRTALMNSQRGNLKEAMQIIGRYHPAFHGIEYPVNWPARELTLQLAQQLANQMGYSTPQDAIKSVLE